MPSIIEKLNRTGFELSAASIEKNLNDVAGIDPGASRTFDTLPRVNPSVMARKSLTASAKKRGVYTNLAFYKCYGAF